METVISPEAGRSSCGCLLTSINQLPEREGPPSLNVEMSKWSPTSKMSRVLGLLLSTWNRAAKLAGRVGCPAEATSSSSSQMLSSQENQSSRTRCPNLLISSGYNRNNLSRRGWWVYTRRRSGMPSSNFLMAPTTAWRQRRKGLNTPCRGLKRPQSPTNTDSQDIAGKMYCFSVLQDIYTGSSQHPLEKRKPHCAYLITMVLNWGWFCSSGDILKCLQTFLIVLIGRVLLASSRREQDPTKYPTMHRTASHGKELYCAKC